MQLLEDQRASAAVESWTEVQAIGAAKSKAQLILSSAGELLAAELGALEHGATFSAPLQEDLRRLAQKVRKEGVTSCTSTALWCFDLVLLAG